MTHYQPQQIFISHSHVDNAFSERITGDIRERLGPRTDIWHDVSGGLSGGDDWWQVIISKLEICDVFLLVVSESAMHSSAVHAELNMAWARKFAGETRIIPVLWGKCETRLDLTTLQYISFLPPKRYDTAFHDLIDALLRPSNSPIISAASANKDLPPVAPAEEKSQRILTSPKRVDISIAVPSLYIFSITNTSPPQRIAVSKNTFTIGRHESNDLVLSDQSVSRYHLRLERAAAQWKVTRVATAGLLYINGIDCDEAILRSGDQLVIGGTVLRFEVLADTIEEQRNTPTVNIAALPPQLIVESHDFQAVVSLRLATLTIGRGPQNTIVIPSVVISKVQARLQREEDGGYRIEDAGAANPLLLHNQPIVKHRLASGDILVIGPEIPSHTVKLTFTTFN